DAVLVTPHRGPNMAPAPVGHVRGAAKAIRDAGATVIAGHSAHIAHGVVDGVLFDLGDFVDDYLVDPVLRNDLGLLFFVTLDDAGPSRIEALPLKLDYGHTHVASGEDGTWIRRRFREACLAMSTDVSEEHGRLAIDLGGEESGHRTGWRRIHGPPRKEVARPRGPPLGPATVASSSSPMDRSAGGSSRQGTCASRAWCSPPSACCPTS